MPLMWNARENRVATVRFSLVRFGLGSLSHNYEALRSLGMLLCTRPATEQKEKEQKKM